MSVPRRLERCGLVEESRGNSLNGVRMLKKGHCQLGTRPGFLEEVTHELGLKYRVEVCQVKIGQGQSVPREWHEP